MYLLFGSKSQFDDLCYAIITALKETHPHIQRIYVRAEYPHINKSYTNYLLQSYEDTYFPEKAINSGRAVYIIRNREMIDKSNFCVLYYKEKHQLKSGTKSAYEYAKKKGKIILNFA